MKPCCVVPQVPAKLSKLIRRLERQLGAGAASEVQDVLTAFSAVCKQFVARAAPAGTPADGGDSSSPGASGSGSAQPSPRWRAAAPGVQRDDARPPQPAAAASGAAAAQCTSRQLFPATAPASPLQQLGSALAASYGGTLQALSSRMAALEAGGTGRKAPPPVRF